jgi:hypothetical protein
MCCTKAGAQSDCQDTFAAELTRLRGAAALADSERYRTSFRAESETLHAMGLNALTSFGIPKLCTGPLSNLAV